ncbi:MAG: hypothetical protein Tsb008_17790 [Rhodothalassiaceae bacterium]
MQIERIPEVIAALANDPLLFIGAALLLSLLSEDAVTVGIALLVAEKHVPLPLGFVAVVFALVAGDAALYGFGAIAARSRTLRRKVATRRIRRARRWVERRLKTILLASRFMPGTRLPTYVASGFFRFSFPLFLAMLTLGAVLWSLFVFGTILLAGRPLLDALGPFSWVGALAILAGGLVLPHLLGPAIARWTGIGTPPGEDDEAK